MQSRTAQSRTAQSRTNSLTATGRARGTSAVRRQSRRRVLTSVVEAMEPRRLFALLAYDGFTGSTGALHTQGGGSGWNTTTGNGSVGWVVQNSDVSLPGYEVQSGTPLTYTGLQQSGNYASGGDSFETVGRRLDYAGSAFSSYRKGTTSQLGADGTTMWFSAVVRRQTAVGAGQTGYRISTNDTGVVWADNTRKFAVGYFGASSDNGGVGYWSLEAGASTVTRTTKAISVNTPTLLVWKIDFTSGNDTASLYVNPGSLGGSAPGTADATASIANADFQNLAWYAGSAAGNGTIDEIRVGGSFADVTPPSGPAAPSGLAASPTAGSSVKVNVSWVDNANNETGYLVERATNSGFTAGYGSDTLAANTSSFVESGLKSATNYYFRVTALGSPANSATVGPVQVTTNTAPNLGAGLNGQSNYNGEFAFTDMTKLASKLAGINGSGNYDTNVVVGLDANNFPTADFGMYLNENSPYTLPLGVYKMTYTQRTPTATPPNISLSLVSATVTNTSHNPTTGQGTFDINVTSNSGAVIFVAKNTGGGFTALQIMRPGYTPGSAPTFTSTYVNFLAANSPNVLRLMDFASTNNNAVGTWAERARPGYFRQTLSLSKTNVPSGYNYTSTINITNAGRGVAWEYGVELANTLGKDLWVNVPILADDNYVTKLAQLLRYGSDGVNPYTSTQANPVYAPLAAGRKVYFEYSNEVWNFQFTQTNINAQLAIREVVDGANNGTPSNLNYDNLSLAVDGNGNYSNAQTWGDRRFAKQTKRFSDLFTAVYGAGSLNTAFVPVLAYQHVSPARFESQLSFINTAYGAPSNYLSAIATAPYFAEGTLNEKTLFGQESAPNPLATKTQLLDALQEVIDSEMGAGGYLDDNVAVAAYYGLKYYAYEGGPDTFGFFNVEAKKQATLDTRMKDLVVDYLTSWYQFGGDQFNWFVIGASSFDSEYGSWAISNDVNNYNQPKEQGFAQIRDGVVPAITAGLALPSSGGTQIDARAYIGSTLANGTGEAPDPAVRYIEQSNKYNYLINAASAGTYSLKLSMTGTAAGTIKVYANNSFVSDLATPVTTGVLTADTAAVNVTLSKGLNVIRLTGPGTGGRQPYGIAALKLGGFAGNVAPIFGGMGFGTTNSVSAGTSFANTFNIYDAETAADSLTYSVVSDNTSVLPNSAIALSGTGSTRTVTISPAAGTAGTANVVVTVSDGTNTRKVNFSKINIVPAVPNTLSGSTPSASEISLTWTDPATTETGFKVEASTTSNFASGTVTTYPVAANATSYVARGLSASTPYWVRVRSTNVPGDSNPSNVVSLTTPASSTGGNSAPTIATGAAAVVAANGLTATLSVLGADNAGEANLSYTWITTGTVPAAVTFSANGTNAAKSTTATFTKVGTYSLRVIAKDAGGLAVVSNVTVTVNPVVTSLIVSGPASVARNATAQYAVGVYDQWGAFAYYLSKQSGFTFTRLTGGAGGVLNSKQLYTAPGSVGSDTLRATYSGVTDDLVLSVT